MIRETHPSVSGQAAEEGIPAGDFSSWLRHARSALSVGKGTDVDCRDCTGCCTSAYFIHVRPGETEALRRIPEEALAAAPGMPKGHKLLAYDKNGVCPMLTGGKCSIYEHRPQTCRNYDCRVFAAAGITAGGNEKSRINQRVERWAFTFPTQRDRDEYAAVRAAAAFIQEHAASFPGGRIPDNPSQLAILAVKVYEVFLGKDGRSGGEAAKAFAVSPAAVAEAIVAASRKFDAGMTAAVR
jgi:Fe-S-cluster containining protein